MEQLAVVNVRQAHNGKKKDAWDIFYFLFFVAIFSNQQLLMISYMLLSIARQSKQWEGKNMQWVIFSFVFCVCILVIIAVDVFICVVLFLNNRLCFIFSALVSHKKVNFTGIVVLDIWKSNR